MTRWQRRSKQAYKNQFEIFGGGRRCTCHPFSHNAGKAVYISGASLYKERAAASEHIFCVETVKENVQLFLRIMPT